MCLSWGCGSEPCGTGGAVPVAPPARPPLALAGCDHMSPLFRAFVSSPAPRSRVWGDFPHPRASEHALRCSNRIICPIYPPGVG